MSKSCAHHPSSAGASKPRKAKRLLSSTMKSPKASRPATSIVRSGVGVKSLTSRVGAIGVPDSCGAVAGAIGAMYHSHGGAALNGPMIVAASVSPSPVCRPASEFARLVNPDLLLPRVALGEAAAIKACIDRFGGLIWSLARRMTHNDAEAEDAVQEIFVEIWQSSYRYDENVASETAFVAMIARRRLIDRRRKADRRPSQQMLPDGVFSQPPHVENTPEIIEEAGMASLALDRLSVEQQRVLRLSIFQGLSHEKIARSTGLPLGTVKTHARRGLIRIRELLEADRSVTEPKPSVPAQESTDQ